MIINGVMFQGFQWYLESDGTYYKKMKEEVDHLASIGITGIWMPPAFKGVSVDDVGYGAYDYWDLGEFNSKGTVRTKYGTKEELIDCVKEFHSKGIQVYGDLVFNHKGGADFSEKFLGVEVDSENRKAEIGEPLLIKGWTGFDFPLRENKYSEFKWHYYHFTGVDYDDLTGKKAIFKIIGENKDWASDTDEEKGSYDYLMYSNIDHNHPEVREELFKVSDWLVEEVGYDGFRYDALKHISRDFIDDLSIHLREKFGEDFYFVGEYWKDDENTIGYYLSTTGYNIDLFDVVLHYNLFEASNNMDFDLRTIFDNTLVKDNPPCAVTFVDNHDSQPGQALESFISPWFKEIAYSLILLRKNGYPCIFYGDYYGIKGMEGSDHKYVIDDLLKVRRDLAKGEEEDFFTEDHLIGWKRFGDDGSASLVVLVSTGDMNEMKVFAGSIKAGKIYRDYSGKEKDIIIDEEGFGVFTVPSKSVTYWGEKI